MWLSRQFDIGLRPKRFESVDIEIAIFCHILSGLDKFIPLDPCQFMEIVGDCGADLCDCCTIECQFPFDPAENVTKENDCSTN